MESKPEAEAEPEKITIDPRDWASKSRLRCPRARHTDWHAREDGFYCESCARHTGADPHYDVLVDLRTGQFVTRAQVRLLGQDPR